MSKEIRVEARLRNNRLYHAIFDSYPSVSAFCEANGFNQVVVGRLLNLNIWPFKKRGQHQGQYIKVCFDLAALFNCLPEYLFPAQLYALEQVKTEKEYSFFELPGLVQAQLLPEVKTPEEIVAQKELHVAMGEVLASLTPREEIVLQKRFGLIEGDEETLEQIGQELGKSPERIRQIERRALRKLRYPERAKKLRQV